MKHERAQPLLPDFALELLTASDRQAVAGHLRTCENCAFEAQVYGDAANALCLAASVVPEVIAVADPIEIMPGDALERIANSVFRRVGVAHLSSAGLSAKMGAPGPGRAGEGFEAADALGTLRPYFTAERLVEVEIDDGFAPLPSDVARPRFVPGPAYQKPAARRKGRFWPRRDGGRVAQEPGQLPPRPSAPGYEASPPAFDRGLARADAPFPALAGEPEQQRAPGWPAAAMHDLDSARPEAAFEMATPAVEVDLSLEPRDVPALAEPEAAQLSRPWQRPDWWVQATEPQEEQVTGWTPAVDTGGSIEAAAAEPAPPPTEYRLASPPAPPLGPVGWDEGNSDLGSAVTDIGFVPEPGPRRGMSRWLRWRGDWASSETKRTARGPDEGGADTFAEQLLQHAAPDGASDWEPDAGDARAQGLSEVWDLIERPSPGGGRTGRLPDAPPPTAQPDLRELRGEDEDGADTFDERLLAAEPVRADEAPALAELLSGPRAAVDDGDGTPGISGEDEGEAGAFDTLSMAPQIEEGSAEAVPFEVDLVARAEVSSGDALAGEAPAAVPLAFGEDTGEEGPPTLAQFTEFEAPPAARRPARRGWLRRRSHASPLARGDDEEGADSFAETLFTPVAEESPSLDDFVPDVAPPTDEPLESMSAVSVAGDAFDRAPAPPLDALSADEIASAGHADVDGPVAVMDADAETAESEVPASRLTDAIAEPRADDEPASEFPFPDQTEETFAALAEEGLPTARTGAAMLEESLSTPPRGPSRWFRRGQEAIPAPKPEVSAAAAPLDEDAWPGIPTDAEGLEAGGAEVPVSRLIDVSPAPNVPIPAAEVTAPEDEAAEAVTSPATGAATPDSALEDEPPVERPLRRWLRRSDEAESAGDGAEAARLAPVVEEALPQPTDDLTLTEPGKALPDLTVEESEAGVEPAAAADVASEQLDAEPGPATEPGARGGLTRFTRRTARHDEGLPGDEPDFLADLLRPGEFSESETAAGTPAETIFAWEEEDETIGGLVVTLPPAPEGAAPPEAEAAPETAAPRRRRGWLRRAAEEDFDDAADDFGADLDSLLALPAAELEVQRAEPDDQPDDNLEDAAGGSPEGEDDRRLLRRWLSRRAEEDEGEWGAGDAFADDFSGLPPIPTAVELLYADRDSEAVPASAIAPESTQHQSVLETEAGGGETSDDGDDRHRLRRWLRRGPDDDEGEEPGVDTFGEEVTEFLAWPADLASRTSWQRRHAHQETAPEDDADATLAEQTGSEAPSRGRIRRLLGRDRPSREREDSRESTDLPTSAGDDFSGDDARAAATTETPVPAPEPRPREFLPPATLPPAPPPEQPPAESQDLAKRPRSRRSLRRDRQRHQTFPAATAGPDDLEIAGDMFTAEAFAPPVLSDDEAGSDVFGEDIFTRQPAAAIAVVSPPRRFDYGLGGYDDREPDDELDDEEDGYDDEDDERQSTWRVYAILLGVTSAALFAALVIGFFFLVQYRNRGDVLEQVADVAAVPMIVSSPGEGRATGYGYYDPTAARLLLVITGFPIAETGRTFVVWAEHAGGTNAVGSTGGDRRSSTTTLQLGLIPQGTTRIFFTDEASGPRPPAPTGSVVVEARPTTAGPAVPSTPVRR